METLLCQYCEYPFIANILYHNCPNCSKKIEKANHTSPSSSIKLDFFYGGNQLRIEQHTIQLLKYGIVQEPAQLYIFESEQIKHAWHQRKTNDSVVVSPKEVRYDSISTLSRENCIEYRSADGKLLLEMSFE